MSGCNNCGKEVKKYHNYCNWDCHIEFAKKNGGKIHAPNNLPIMCITGHWTMLEVAHGDHPDYKFPVTAEYFGDKSKLGRYRADGTFIPPNEKDILIQSVEHHALVYCDGVIAVTLYECGYHMWYIQSNKELKHESSRSSEWRLSQESLARIAASYPYSSGD